MTDALKAADDILAVLPATVDGGAIVKSAHAAVLDAGSLEGLELQRGSVRMVQAQLDALGPDIDVKLLRAGNEAARDLVKAALRVAEGAFRAQEGNALLQLLESLKAPAAVKTVVDQSDIK